MLYIRCFDCFLAFIVSRLVVFGRGGRVQRIAFYSYSDLVTCAFIIRIYQLELLPFIRKEGHLFIFLQNSLMFCKKINKFPHDIIKIIVSF